MGVAIPLKDWKKLTAEVETYQSSTAIKNKADTSCGATRIKTLESSDPGTRKIELYSRPKRTPTTPKDHRDMKTILVVGQTGAGKTTMLNAMLNYCEKVLHSDDFRYECVDERSLLLQGHGGHKSTTQ